jgi:hypothetical protein
MDLPCDNCFRGDEESATGFLEFYLRRATTDCDRSGTT